MPTNITLNASGSYDAPIDAAEVSVALHMRDNQDYYDKTDEWTAKVKEAVSGAEVEINEAQKHTPNVTATVAVSEVAATLAKIVETVGRSNVEKVRIGQRSNSAGAHQLAAAQAVLNAKFEAGQIAQGLGLVEAGVLSISEVKYKEQTTADDATFEGEEIDKAAQGEGLVDLPKTAFEASADVVLLLLSPMEWAQLTGQPLQQPVAQQPAAEAPVEEAGVQADEVAAEATEDSEEAPAADEVAEALAEDAEANEADVPKDSKKK